MISTSADMKIRATKHHAPRWHVRTSDGQDWTRLLTDGQITKTSGRSPRTTASITLTERGKPGALDQGLLPLGRDVILSYRIHPYAEEITVATGRLTNSSLQRDASTWVMEIADHSAVVAIDLTNPTQWGTKPSAVDAAIRALVLRTLPSATFNITGPSIGASVPADLKWDGDPWAIIEGLSQGTGSEAYFDASGVCVVRAEPTIGLSALDRLAVGNDGVITAYSIEHEAAYSRVEIRYEDKSTPPVVVLGVWEDHRADSPTAVARIGRVALREDHASLLGLPSQDAANSAAAALAQRAAGRGRRAVVRHIPRPWIEPGDTVEVVLSGGPTELHFVESVDIPIRPDVQVTTLRNYAYLIEEAA